MKRIMLITQSLQGGGAEKSAAYLSMGLSQKYELILVSTNRGEVEFQYGGKLIELNVISGRSLWERIKNFIYKYYKIKQLKKEYSPCVTISFLGLPNLLNVLTKGTDKTILSIRNITSTKKGRKSKWYKLLMWYMSLKADAFVTLSDFAKNDLIDVYNVDDKKIYTIYNICDVDMIKRKIGNIDVSYENYIVSIGRLCLEKGQWHLIRIFNTIHKEHPDYKLVIVGDGELRHKYEKMIEEMRLDDCVIITGWKTNPYDYIKHADLLVFTSISEGLGNVLLEALALSKAIVSCYSIGGSNEVLCPELVNVMQSVKEITLASWAVITPRLDYDNIDVNSPLNKAERILADAIELLITNKTLRKEYEVKAEQRARQFSPERIIGHWEWLIERI